MVLIPRVRRLGPMLRTVGNMMGELLAFSVPLVFLIIGFSGRQAAVRCYPVAWVSSSTQASDTVGLLGGFNEHEQRKRLLAHIFMHGGTGRARLSACVRANAC